MLNKKIILFIGLFISSLFVWVGPTHSSEALTPLDETENSGKFGLLIGINKYDNGVPALKGAVNDALAMKGVLTGKFGFPDNEKHIRVLTDEQATRDKILDSFRDHLIKNAREYKEKTDNEATIFFHYSGHGSRTAPPDFMTKEDEPDGWDETLVPFDSGRNDDAESVDIRDDEIFALVRELSKYTSNVVYVFDSCHSGTVNRGDDISREAPPDKRKQPAYQIADPGSRGDGQTRDENYDDFLTGGDKFVVIAGTRSGQRAYETLMVDGSYRGTLSFYLQQALQNALPQTTYGELMRRVKVEVNHHKSDQEPQISGDKNRLIMGGKFEEGEIPIPVISVKKEEKTVLIGAGKMLGLRTGSLIAVYDKDKVKIAEGEITKVEKNEASATYRLLGDKSINPTTDTVKLLSPLFGAEAVQVQLQLNNKSNSRASGTGADAVLKDVAKKLREEQKDLFRIDLLEPGQKSRAQNKGPNISSVSVGQAGFREAFCGGIKTENFSTKAEAEKICQISLPEPRFDEKTKKLIPVPEKDEEVFYIAPTGSKKPVFDFYVRVTDKKAVEKISEALTKYARQKNLLALANRDGRLARDLKIEFVEVRGHFDDNGDFVTDSKTVSDLDDGLVSKPKGVFYRLKITNKSTTGDLFVTVLNLSNDGAINVMYPLKDEAQEQILRGKAVETDLFVTSRPFGMETIKIITTKDYSDFSGLSHGAVSRDVRTAENPLTRLLKQAVFGTRSGGGATLSLKTDEWDVTDILLQITPD